eukprot:482922-Prymnesium_polylepis.1
MLYTRAHALRSVRLIVGVVVGPTCGRSDKGPASRSLTVAMPRPPCSRPIVSCRTAQVYSSR